MGLFKRNNTWWIDYRENGRRIRKSLGCRDNVAAKIKAGKILQAVELRSAGIETHPDTREANLVDLLKEYEEAIKGRGRTTDYAEKTTRQLARLFDWGNINSLRTATTRHLEVAVSKLSDRSARTQNESRGHLRTFFRWLNKTGRWSSNPADALGNIRQVEKTKDRRALTSDELERLLDRSPRHRSLIYRVAVTTGMRRKELRILRRADVDLERRIVTIRATNAKNRKPALQPIPESTCDALSEWWENPTVKFSKQGNMRWLKALDPDMALPPIPNVRTYYRDLERVDIPQVTDSGELDFHSLRVTYVTNLARAGVPLVLAQKLARHSTPVLTANIYTKLDIFDARDAVDLLEKAMAI